MNPLLHYTAPILSLLLLLISMYRGVSLFLPWIALSHLVFLTDFLIRDFAFSNNPPILVLSANFVWLNREG